MLGKLLYIFILLKVPRTGLEDILDVNIYLCFLFQKQQLTFIEFLTSPLLISPQLSQRVRCRALFPIS